MGHYAMATRERIAARKAAAGSAAPTSSKKIERGGAIFAWTEAEKERIARESLLMMANDGTLSRLEALRKAVGKLPPNRRKIVKDMAHSSWILPYWDRFAAEKDALNQAAGLFDVAAPQPIVETAEAEAEGVDIDGPARPLELVVTGAEAPVEPEPEEAKTAATHARMAKARAAFQAKKAAGEVTYVKWKDGERRTVAKAFVKLRHDFPDMKDRAALVKAMEYSLPDNRQKTITSFPVEYKTWLRECIEIVTAEVEIERQMNEAAAREAAEVEAKEREEREAAERVEAERKKQIEEINNSALELAESAAAEARATAIEQYRANAPLEELIGVVARRLAGALLAPLVDEFRNAIASGLASVRAPQTVGVPVKPAPRERLPLVGVAGLIRQQAQQLERDYAGQCAFVFGGDTDGTGAHGVSSKFAQCDLVLLMADYVSHDVRGKVQNFAPGFVPLRGSLSSARVNIDKWLAGETRLVA